MIRTYIQTHIRTYVHTYDTYIHTHAHICIHTYIHMHLYTYVQYQAVAGFAGVGGGLSWRRRIHRAGSSCLNLLALLVQKYKYRRSRRCRATSRWCLLRPYLYFCTSKASKFGSKGPAASVFERLLAGSRSEGEGKSSCKLN